MSQSDAKWNRQTHSLLEETRAGGSSLPCKLSSYPSSENCEFSAASGSPNSNRPLPEEPLDLLAEIERELPLVTIRRHPESFRDTDSIRFLKQNRLSWWTPPKECERIYDNIMSNSMTEGSANSRRLQTICDTEPHDERSGTPDNFYDSPDVIYSESNGTPLKLDASSLPISSSTPAKKNPVHVYEDIPDNFFERNRAKRALMEQAAAPAPVTIGDKTFSPTNPFAVDLAEAALKEKKTCDREDFLRSMCDPVEERSTQQPQVPQDVPPPVCISTLPSKKKQKQLRSTLSNPGTSLDVYDIPKGSTVEPFYDLPHFLQCPPSEYSRPNSVSTHDASMISTENDFYPWNETGFEPIASPVSTLTRKSEQPSEMTGNLDIDSPPQTRFADQSMSTASSLEPLKSMNTDHTADQIDLHFATYPRRTTVDEPQSLTNILSVSNGNLSSGFNNYEVPSKPRHSEFGHFGHYDVPSSLQNESMLSQDMFYTSQDSTQLDEYMSSMNLNEERTPLTGEGVYDVPSSINPLSSRFSDTMDSLNSSIDIPPPNYPAPQLVLTDLQSTDSQSSNETTAQSPKTVPIPKPRSVLPKKEQRPPLPPKTTPEKPPRRSLQERKYSLPDKQAKEANPAPSLTSWYVPSEALKTQELTRTSMNAANADTASLSDQSRSDETLSSISSPSRPVSRSGRRESEITRFLQKVRTPQRSSSQRLTSAIKTVSSKLQRKSSAIHNEASFTDHTNNSEIISAESRDDLICIYVYQENRKEYIRKLTTVLDDTLKFYDSELDTSPSAWFTVNEITLLIAKREVSPAVKNIPPLFLLDLHTLSGNVRRIGFTSDVSRSLYLNLINSYLQETNGLQGPVWGSGLVYHKDGIGGEWSSCRMFLHGNFISTFHPAGGFNKYDIRKVQSIDWTQNSEGIGSPPGLSDDNKSFHMILSGRTVYLQATLSTDTNRWFELLKNAHTVNLDKSLLSEQYLNNDNVPVAVEKCVNFVSAHGSAVTGIYRLAGSCIKVEKLVQSLQKDAWGVHLVTERYSPNDVANALKRFLRSFKDCLLTRRLYDQWLDCSKIENIEDKKHRMKDLLSDLSEVHYATLKYLCGHLRSISDNHHQNCMTITNLAAIFGPSVFYKHAPGSYMDKSQDRESATNRASMEQMAETNAAMNIFNDLISNYSWLFGISEEVLEKERQIQKAMRDFREARVAQRPAGDMLVGVYVYNREWGNCVNVKLTPTMTAGELCRYVCNQQQLKDTVSSLAVFEVICGQQLERPLHFSETVLSSVLQWTGWDQVFAKENYLCIKKNYVYDEVTNYLHNSGNGNHPISLSTEARISEFGTKSFRKVTLEFTQSMIQVVKESKKGKIVTDQWNIEEVYWYLGCESSRKPPFPSKQCFSFVHRNAQVKKNRERSFLTTCISVPSQGDLTRWLACMLCAEFSSLTPPVEQAPDLLSL